MRPPVLRHFDEAVACLESGDDEWQEGTDAAFQLSFTGVPEAKPYHLRFFAQDREPGEICVLCDDHGINRLRVIPDRPVRCRQ